jgi:hypothetical protein
MVLEGEDGCSIIEKHPRRANSWRCILCGEYESDLYEVCGVRGGLGEKPSANAHERQFKGKGHRVYVAPSEIKGAVVGGDACRLIY